MIAEGEEAPGFELPAVVGGEFGTVSLSAAVGGGATVVTFYPGDFGPAAGDSGLAEFDLFATGKDVTVLAVGPDTTHSHAAFASTYDLSLPLLADTRGAVAELYGVEREDEYGGRTSERAVFVLDHDGVVVYRWHDPDPEATPPVDEIRDAVAATGGDDAALSRYRVGYAHYREGRRAFTSAVAAYGDGEWLPARADFGRAGEEFATAADHFDSAARFADDPAAATVHERTEEKARALWDAADWLADSAEAAGGGDDGEARGLREDAERPLLAASELGRPVRPEEWPPDPDDPDLVTADTEPSGFTVEPGADASDAVVPPRATPPTDAGGIGEDELARIEAELSGPEEGGWTGFDGPSAPDESGVDGSTADDGPAGETALAELRAEIAASEPDRDADADASRFGRATGSAPAGDDPAADEPVGASDDDLADIPTTEELAGESGGDGLDGVPVDDEDVTLDGDAAGTEPSLDEDVTVDGDDVGTEPSLDEDVTVDGDDVGTGSDRGADGPAGDGDGWASLAGDEEGEDGADEGSAGGD